jgi:hypothetical protein
MQNSGRESPNSILIFPLSSFIARCAPSMIAPETFSRLEDIKKRAGHLWRFL